jgi:hypothetical protein
MLALSYSTIGNTTLKMSFICCVGSIYVICMTLDYNVFSRVISEDVISMSLFMVLETIGRMT